MMHRLSVLRERLISRLACIAWRFAIRCRLWLAKQEQVREREALAAAIESYLAQERLAAEELALRAKRVEWLRAQHLSLRSGHHASSLH